MVGSRMTKLMAAVPAAGSRGELQLAEVEVADAMMVVEAEVTPGLEQIEGEDNVQFSPWWLGTERL